LASRGHDVVCAAPDADQNDPARDSFLAPFRNKVVLRRLDVTQRQELDDLIARHSPRHIVHAAAITPTQEIESSKPGEVLSVNVMGTLNALEAGRRALAGRFVYISSAAVYGDGDEAASLTEDMPTNPKGLYAISKDASERLCTHYNAAYGTDTVAMRVGWVYGPMERPMPSSSWDMSLVYHFVRLAMASQEIRVTRLKHIRDWICSLDLAQAVCHVLEQPRLPSRCYNLSGGRGYSHRELLDSLSKVIPVRYRHTDDREQANVPFQDTRRRRGPTSIDRILSETQYRPRLDLVRGLRLYVRWVRSAQRRLESSCQ
jgi:nucleoside-diphosphate-sugar epimerase